MSPHELVLKAKHYNKHGITWEIDTRKSTWFGDPIYTLGSFGRRKFENWVILENATERFNILYT